MFRGIGYAAALLILAMLGNTSETAAYVVADVENGGTITGRVTFEGTVPAPKRFEVEKDPDVCGRERSLIEVAAANGFLQGAVVVLEGVEKGKPFSTEGHRGSPPGEGAFQYSGGDRLSLEVHTKRCNFGPFTGVLAADEPVRFLNHDPMKHVLHSFSAFGEKGLILRTIHNRDIHPETPIERTFRATRLKTSRVVRITCNRHDFMQNWLYVVRTPYFSMTDHDGRFTIDEVPPGRYELIAWHPALGLKRQAVSVTAAGQVEASFGFSEE